jgi:hypothetical protein
VYAVFICSSKIYLVAACPVAKDFLKMMSTCKMRVAKKIARIVIITIIGSIEDFEKR